MIETPNIAQVPAQRTAMLHILTPRSKMQEVMGPGIGEVMAAVRAQGIGPTGPWFTHHMKITTETFDFNICVPVSAPVSLTGRVVPGERPTLKVARTIYSGPYEGLGDAWNEFMQWIDAQGHRTASDLYECYQVGPETSLDPSEWRTELIRPLLER
jgi:effector-binding domain-containing protein